jgi:hypothetical protein
LFDLPNVCRQTTSDGACRVAIRIEKGNTFLENVFQILFPVLEGDFLAIINMNLAKQDA